MLAWKMEGTKLYQLLPKEMFENCKLTEPLIEAIDHQPDQNNEYTSWQLRKRK